MTTDKHLSFKKTHREFMSECELKLHAFRRIRKHLTVKKAKLLGIAFIDSQFNYAPLISMFCQKTLYIKIEKIHHKTLRIIHQPNASYRDLLECSVSTSIRQRHLQFLLTEIYEITVTTNPRFMWHFFKEREIPHNLRKDAVLFVLPAKSTILG